MQRSRAGGMEAGCTELLCSPGGGDLELLFTVRLLSCKGRIQTSSENLGRSLTCRTKATSQPVFDNKLLLISGFGGGETNLEKFLVPWVWFCCCRMTCFAVTSKAVPAREGWHPCSVPCSSWECLFQTKTSPSASYLGGQEPVRDFRSLDVQI